MPIAPGLITHVELVMRGLIAAGGSDSIRTDTTFHYRRTNNALAIDKAAFNTVWQAGPGAAILAALNNRWSQTLNDVRWLDDIEDPYESLTESHPGGVAGDGLASYTFIYMLYRTAKRGKSYRGNNKFGPLSEADATAAGDDILNAAATTRFNAVKTALLASLTDAIGNVWDLEVVSRKKSNFTVQPATIVANDVNGIFLNKRISETKRRKVSSVY